MPVGRMRRVVEYCTYNKAFFVLVLILFGALNYIVVEYRSSDFLITLLVSFFMYIIIMGYGMTIARDRMNNGIRLPKIMVRDVLILGFKSVFVSAVYLIVQEFVLDIICSPLDFPQFDLEEMLLDLSETIRMLFSHNPIDALFFIVVGAMLFYVTVFFMEIALARLADTGSLISAFNLSEIKRDIDLIGRGHYVMDYTLIVLAIVFFAYLKVLVIPVSELNFI